MMKKLMILLYVLIGHHFVEHVYINTDWNIIIIDKLSYASNGFERLRDTGCLNDDRVKVFTNDLINPIPEGIQKEIGKNVKYGAGSGIEGILEPAGRLASIVEDNVKIGAMCEVTGIIGEGSVIASGVIMASGKKIFDERRNYRKQKIFFSPRMGFGLKKDFMEGFLWMV